MRLPLSLTAGVGAVATMVALWAWLTPDGLEKYTLSLLQEAGLQVHETSCSMNDKGRSRHGYCVFSLAPAESQRLISKLSLHELAPNAPHIWIHASGCGRLDWVGLSPQALQMYEEAKILGKAVQNPWNPKLHLFGTERVLPLDEKTGISFFGLYYHEGLNRGCIDVGYRYG